MPLAFERHLQRAARAGQYCVCSGETTLCFREITSEEHGSSKYIEVLCKALSFSAFTTVKRVDEFAVTVTTFFVIYTPLNISMTL